jgi:hypothetical protein
MRSRTLGITLTAIGVVALAIAAVLTWAVVPALKRLPSDTDTVRRYDGKLNFGLDARALQGGNLSTAILVNTPVTSTRTVKVLATSGDTAQVRDSRTVASTSGQGLASSEATYAVDRRSLAATSSHPSGWQVVDARGLTVSWPIGAKPQQYTGWVNETRSTTPLKYLRTEQRGGIGTYVYQAETGATQIRDQATLDTLPKTLPVNTVKALSGLLNLSGDAAGQLTRILPQLADPIPLAYTYQLKATYWVQPTTGIVVDTRLEEVRRAGVRLPNGAVAAAVLPVANLSLATTAASVTQAADDARHRSGQITLWGTTIPLILLAVGLIALVAGIVYLLLRGRRGARPRQPTGGGGRRRRGQRRLTRGPVVPAGSRGRPGPARAAAPGRRPGRRGAPRRWRAADAERH